MLGSQQALRVSLTRQIDNALGQALDGFSSSISSPQNLGDYTLASLVINN